MNSGTVCGNEVLSVQWKKQKVMSSFRERVRKGVPPSGISGCPLVIIAGLRNMTLYVLHCAMFSSQIFSMICVRR